MFTLVKRGLTLALFTTGLLAGLQLPGFAQQYEQRLSARLAESKLSLTGFQAVADKFHDGDLHRLIQHHRQSEDASFAAEAEPIYALWKRVAFLSNEQVAMQGALPKKLWHLVTSADSELLKSTASGYSNVVPVNTAAISCGILGGLLLILLGASVSSSGKKLIARCTEKRPPQSEETAKS